MTIETTGEHVRTEGDPMALPQREPAGPHRVGNAAMSTSLAHLVDHVLPAVPVRQWVLSLPFRLRYLLAWDHDLCRAVMAVFARTALASSV